MVESAMGRQTVALLRVLDAACASVRELAAATEEVTRALGSSRAVLARAVKNLSASRARWSTS